jgi:hypothetical protein
MSKLWQDLELPLLEAGRLVAQKVAFVGLLAAALMLSASGTANAAELISSGSCTYSGSIIEIFDTYDDEETSCFTGDTNTFFFDFGKFVLTLHGLTGSTDITVTNYSLTQEEFDGMNAIADADCVPLLAPDGSDDGCRLLQVTASNLNFDSWTQTTYWNNETNSTYPNGSGEPGNIRVYLGEGDPTVDNFTVDMCLAAISDPDAYEPCVYYPSPAPGDPGIRSGNTDFSFMAVTSVPEPTTLILLGVALPLLARSRRRTNN